MDNQFEIYQKEPEKKWIAGHNDQAIEVVANLVEALKINDLNQIQELLKNPQTIRGILLNRKEKSKNLVILNDSFDQMFIEQFGSKTDIYSVSSADILKWINEIGWPEYILSDMLATAYHLKDHHRFFRFLTIILENEKNFTDKTVVGIALHNLATWEAMAEKDQQKSIELNKTVVGKARELGDKVLETKSLYGLTFSKKLKPKEKATDFEKYASIFEQSGDEYDSIQAMNEASKAYLVLAKGQWGNSASLKLDNLDKAESIALKSIERADTINYSNALWHAHDILGDIYFEKGKTNQANEHKKIAQSIKKEIGYQY